MKQNTEQINEKHKMKVERVQTGIRMEKEW